MKAILFVALAGLGLSCGYAESCSGELSVIGQGCPMTFDGTLEDLPRCDFGGTVTGRTCGGLHEQVASVLHGRKCYYDTATHKLVGARLDPGMELVCRPGGSLRTAGRQFAPECEDVEPSVVRDCVSGDPDAGAG